MKYIKIQSQGVIQEEAFTLLGASTKKGDTTKIGYYGSGLKYSIAYLLRNDIPFKAYGDYKEFAFTTKKTSFRDKDFDVICVNGKETSLTTAMGADWEAWFILREIYCNALDEGESSIEVITCEPHGLSPIEDKTVFYIGVSERFDEVIANWDTYFSEKRSDIVSFDVEGNQIYAGGDNLIVYRKGIRCQFLKDEKCSFNYDMDWVVINESRVIADDWNFRYSLTRHLQKIKDPKIITHLYNTICKTYEKDLKWDLQIHNYSDEWLACLNKKVLVPLENAGYWHDDVSQSPYDYITLPSKMIEGLKSRFQGDIKVIGDVEGSSSNGDVKFITELTKKQVKLLDDARSFLASANYQIKYEIKIVDFVKANRLGQAKDGTILLSQKLFDRGRKELVSCIIEEQEHLVTGYNDETREFQTHFINKCVTLMEELTNNYL